MKRELALCPDFPEGGHCDLRRLRENHFWFVHRKSMILRIASECLETRQNARVLEFGCGDGDVLGALSTHWWTVGLERRLGDLAMARKSGAIRVVAAEGSAPPFSRSFDMVGLFDVVEHVEDDRELLRRAAALVSPGGWVLLTVPADPRLWTSLDTYAGHYRRYTRRMMLDLLTAADLRLERLLPLFRVLWPLGLLRAALRGKTPIRDLEKEYRVPPLVNRVLLSGLAIERTVAGASSRGTGTSWLASARVLS